MAEVIAILRGLHPQHAIPIMAAGIKSIEVPLNSPDPFDSIKMMAEHPPEGVTVGAGTVTNAADAQPVSKAGAPSIGARNFNPDVTAAAKALGPVVLPGVTTPTEAFAALTRSHDRRIDPSGGLWFSTMSRDAQTQVAAIYRYANGTLRKLHDGLTIPDAICFSPFANWLNFAELLGLSPKGDEVGRIALPTPHVTCPATGPDGIYITSALFGLPKEARQSDDRAGKTLLVKDAFQGLPNVPVKLTPPDTELTQ
jgi:sugar lactone lactonase YvrE